MYNGFKSPTGERDGFGILHAEDGTFYSGQWAANRRNGHGAFFWEGGVFEGEWVDGRAHGSGTVNFKNGDIFTGQYAYNQKCGHGTYHWSDGAEETGQYAANKKTGWHFWKYKNKAWSLLYDQGDVIAAQQVDIPADAFEGSLMVEAAGDFAFCGQQSAHHSDTPVGSIISSAAGTLGDCLRGLQSQ